MKKWQFWLGIAISAVFLYFALRGLNLGDFWSAIKSANYWWIFPGIAVYFVGVWARAWRWHYLLKPIKNIKTRVMFPITCIGYMGNNIYPARAGEVLRAVVLKRKEGVAISASLATIIVERVFDSVVMLAFVFVNLPELAKVAKFDSGFAGNIQQLAFIGMGIFLGALIIFLLAAMFPKTTEKICLWLINRIIPKKFREKTIGITLKFLEGLVSLRSPANVLMVFFTSVIIWLLETVKYWFVMHAFTFTVSFFALMLLNGIANLVTIIPAAPGYIGTWEAVTKAILVAYNVPGGEALGYAIVLHVALWLPITLLGAYYMTREGIKWNDTLRKETENNEPQAE
ncbi:MAG: lysylphosphatidylglycerol synthase transmembrane domain-containing protein [Anaerolineaceae bacterium]|nr:TIGR00374 family protein [Anaerolineaceae bacterium]